MTFVARSIGPRVFQSQAPRSWKTAKWTCRSRMTRLLCARWMFVPSVLFGPRCAPETIKKSGASFAARGLPFSAGRGACGWTGAVNAEAQFGPGFARGGVLSSSFRVRARTLGSLNEEMGLRVAFIIGYRRTIVCRASRTSSRFSGAWILSCLLVGNLRINFFGSSTVDSLVGGWR